MSVERWVSRGLSGVEKVQRATVDHQVGTCDPFGRGTREISPGLHRDVRRNPDTSYDGSLYPQVPWGRDTPPVAVTPRAYIWSVTPTSILADIATIGLERGIRLRIFEDQDRVSVLEETQVGFSPK